ncbi:MAG: sugar ABC transporter permease [Rubrobacteraceae bacterium]|uniref:carbohydrate ABC transporter permease n=1 Tax=Rubrobacter naiadicus TaxID=1392641 RepID=UPI00235FD722|nr:sugar ABC transporter permease [Rubrobacter naiadicus]MBX6763276.1 sugar ABC transporter permease [Rubrobacteraceae bacterium]MCL6438447.1 sugar ABC transporter permease [Rubrobacteraceae bacterium]
MASQVRAVRGRSWAERLAASPAPWLAPLGLVLAITFLYPIVEIIRLSFTNASLTGGNYSYTLGSYARLFGSPYFASMVRVTVIFVFFSVVFQILLGFLIALAVDQGARRGMRASIVTRTAVLSAWAIPGVIIGIIWGILYQESGAGVLNYLAQLLGFGQIPFLSSPRAALASVTVANIWRGTAFSMILLYAGIQTLPADVLEAARVDGANAWQRLTRVVVPLLAPILLVTLVIVSIDTFNTFDMVLALTGGGPGRATEVIALSIYDQIFQQFDLGPGAATAVVLLAINAIMTFVYLRLERPEELS